MPTNLFQSRTIFDDSDFSILATIGDLSSPRMITVDPTCVGLNPDGVRIIPPGVVLIRGNGAAAGLGRPYPGSTAAAASAIATNTVTVRHPEVFRVGDVLSRAAFGTVTNTPVGTIAAINMATGVINLVAAIAGTAVANGDNIYVTNVPRADVLGLVLNQHNITADSNNVAAYASAVVYGARLPFWNTDLQNWLPEMKLV